QRTLGTRTRTWFSTPKGLHNSNRATCVQPLRGRTVEGVWYSNVRCAWPPPRVLRDCGIQPLRGKEDSTRARIHSFSRLVFFLCVFAALYEFFFLSPLAANTVGMSVRLTQVLPGSELEVKPLVDRRSPIVLRIVHSEAMGNGYR